MVLMVRFTKLDIICGLKERALRKFMWSQGHLPELITSCFPQGLESTDVCDRRRV